MFDVLLMLVDVGLSILEAAIGIVCWMLHVRFVSYVVDLDV